MKEVSSTDLYKIIKRRDARYDGRFYFGARTTGIYCRVICPARPKLKNMIVFKSPSEAEASNYRPCLRCRPDLSPQSLFFDGTFRTVSRALRLIEENQDLKIQDLSLKLGLSDRHVRRLFEEHLGASPIQIITTKRLHLAKQLLLSSSDSITNIAFAVGFNSIRRFNEAFKTLYKVSPSEIRKTKQNFSQRARTQTEEALQFHILVHLPYDFDNVLSYLERHEAFGLEKVNGQTYTRYIKNKRDFGKLQISLEKNRLNLKFFNFALDEIGENLRRIKNLFDVDHNPKHLSRKNALYAKGIRVPGAFDSYEVAVSIILGQLISTSQAKAKLKALIIKYGEYLGDDNGQAVYAFPNPKVLAQAKLEDLGLTTVRAEAIRSLSAKLLSEDLDLNSTADPETSRRILSSIRGIGPWTEEVIAMRCLRDPDAFPINDLVLKRALKKHKFETWKYSKAYLSHCLWRDSSKRKIQ